MEEQPASKPAAALCYLQGCSSWSTTLSCWQQKNDLLGVWSRKRGSVGMGKCTEDSDRTEVRLGQDSALSSGTVTLSGGRQAGILKQPRRAQY